MTKDDFNELAEDLMKATISNLFENGSGSTISDAWGYWEEEWREEQKAELLEEIKSTLEAYLDVKA